MNDEFYATDVSIVKARGILLDQSADPRLRNRHLRPRSGTPSILVHQPKGGIKGHTGNVGLKGCYFEI